MEDDKRGSLSQPGLWAEQKFSPWEFITMSLEFDGVPLLCSSRVALKRSDLLLPISLQGCPIPIILNFHDVVLGYFFIHCAEHVVLSEHVLHTMNGLAPSALSTGLAKTFIWVFLLRCYGKTRVNVLVNSILRIHLSLLCLAVAICLWVFYFPRF